MFEQEQLDQAPGRDGQGTPPSTPKRYAPDSLARAWDANPELAHQVALDAPEPVDPPKPSKVFSLWETIKGAGRGVAEAVNNTATGMRNAISDVQKKAGMAPLTGPGATKAFESKESIAQWWDDQESHRPPTVIPEAGIDEVFGKKKEGIAGFVEGATQFVTGLALARLTGGAGGSTVIKGAAAELFAFDPHQERLSNMLADHLPTKYADPLRKYLAANDDDSASIARFKQAAEGVLTNKLIDGVISGVKLAKGIIWKPAAKEAAEDVAKVAVTPEGHTVVPTKGAPEEIKAAQPGHTMDQVEAETLAASFNYVAKNQKIAMGALDEESLKEFNTLFKQYEKTADQRGIEELRDTFGINFNYTNGPEEAVNAIKAMVDVFPEPSTIARNIPRTHEETIARAGEILGGFADDPAKAVEAARKVFGVNDPEAALLATRAYLVKQAGYVAKLSEMVDVNPKNSVAVEELGKAMDSLMELHAHVTGSVSSAGRVLESQKIAAEEVVAKAGENAAEVSAQASMSGKTITGQPLHRSPTGLGPRSINTLGDMTQDDITRLAKQISLVGPTNAEAVLKLVRGPKLSTDIAKKLAPSGFSQFMTFQNLYRVNAMLSGPKTQITNAVSNMITAFQVPSEYWWAGVRTGDAALRQKGADMMMGNFLHFWDSMKMAKMAFAKGDGMLIPTIEDGATELTKMNPLGQMTFMDLMQMPSRMLMSSDELFKQMSYRSNMRAQLLKQARDRGVTEAADLAKHVTDNMEFAFKDGKAINPLAAEYAKRNTFTNALRKDSMQQGILEFVNKHPMARLVLPFVRTPMNIFNFAWERSPFLNRFNKDFAEAMSGKLGEEARSLAMAKSDAGKVIWGTASMFALSGQITGRGPSDVELRKDWIAAGNQPYSVKVPGTNQWISYRRANPALTAFGLVADVVTMAGELHELDFGDGAAAITSSIISNVSSQTFMRGIADFSDAVGSNDPNKLKKFFETTAASYIPNAGNQLNSDDTFREARGFIDQLASRVPGMSQDLEPRRNILGEKIMRAPNYGNRAFNPFTVAPGAEAGSVQDELVKLGKHFSMPATSRENGQLDLTDRQTYNDRDGQSPYDRMMELMAKPASPGMQPLRTQLERIIQSRAYQNAPAEDVSGPGGLRFEMLNNVIQGYQEAAWGQVLKEYPTLRQAYVQANNIAAQGKAHGAAGIESATAKYSQLFVKTK